MNFNGGYSENVNIFNYKKQIKNKLYYSLHSRKDYADAELNWGESVIVKVAGDNPFVDGQTISILNHSKSSPRFTVLKSIDEWLLIKMNSTDGTDNFIRFTNSTDIQYTIGDGYNVRNISRSDPTNTYDIQTVELRSVDNMVKNTNFGKMILRTDDIGTITIYNLNYGVFDSIVSSEISDTLFDLCVDDVEYRPIVRGLSLVEKNTSFGHLVFKYSTNSGLRYVVVTTKRYENDFSIYPDALYDDLSFVNISSDFKVQLLHSNFLNDLSFSDIIQNGTLTKIPDARWCSRKFVGDKIYDYTHAEETIGTASVTNGSNVIVLNGDVVDVFGEGDKIKIISTTYTITSVTQSSVELSVAYTGSTSSTADIIADKGTEIEYMFGSPEDYSFTDGYTLIHIAQDATGTISSISIDARHNLVNGSKFKIKDFTADTTTEHTVTAIGDSSFTFTPSIVATGDIAIYSDVYIPFIGKGIFVTVIDDKLYLYDSELDDILAREYSLTDIMCKFTVAASGENIAFRQLSIFNGNDSEKECIYLSENQLVTITDGNETEFTIII